MLKRCLRSANLDVTADPSARDLVGLVVRNSGSEVSCAKWSSYGAFIRERVHDLFTTRAVILCDVGGFFACVDAVHADSLVLIPRNTRQQPLKHRADAQLTGSIQVDQLAIAVQKQLAGAGEKIMARERRG